MQTMHLSVLHILEATETGILCGMDKLLAQRATILTCLMNNVRTGTQIKEIVQLMSCARMCIYNCFSMPCTVTMQTWDPLQLHPTQTVQSLLLLLPQPPLTQCRLQLDCSMQVESLS